ncbi:MULTISPECIES: hypothetical protein [unclassified Streptomyces]|uniref:hypothetical protein n=1 Tax=unclassified Streptomyces TaxID=2593676 RepID=UPI000366C2F1|nr:MULTISPECIES: hypothetical protein [unclassified Streptomyces]MYS37222.1 hypothetical protein [Streptomyces sp. SID4920]MYX64266.1 hypothetical protein [Streptomyces sp. SID8373]
MSDELPKKKVAGVEYLSCEWCGEAVSQLGSWSPRRYCKRSHRQRAFEARRLGQPMMRDRGKEEVATPAADVAPSPPAPQLWDDDMEARLARYGIGPDGQELPAAQDQPRRPPARDA